MDSDYEDAWELAAQNREDWGRGMFDDEEEGGEDDVA
jgi:hypothetical protein